MNQVKIERQSLKGIKIHEDKGGRTERIDSTAKPEIKKQLAKILAERKISLADWIEMHVLSDSGMGDQTSFGEES